MAGEVRFYHLQRQSIEEALPLLVSRAYAAGYRQVLHFDDPGLAKTLDERLWTYDQDSFLPHGLAGGKHDAAHPILLTTGDAPEPVGDPCALIQVGAPRTPARDGFARVMVMFDGRDPDQVQAARDYWRMLKDSDDELSYWQQSDSGKWEQKA